MLKQKNKKQISFLGTNGWYSTRTGNTICVLVETDQAYIVLDAGDGLSKLDRYVKTNKPIYIFISHFHLDHIIGLHALAKFKFKQPVYLCWPSKYKKALNTIMSRIFTVPLKGLKLNIKVIALPARAKRIKFLQRYLPLRHSQPSYGLCFDLAGCSLAYIPDTGLCDNAIQLAAGADYLIAECAFKAGQSDKHWPHLTPVTAARLARQAKAGRLFLVHFDAAVYRTLKERSVAEKQAKKIHQNTIATKDGYREVLK